MSTSEQKTQEALVISCETEGGRSEWADASKLRVITLSPEAFAKVVAQIEKPAEVNQRLLNTLKTLPQIQIKPGPPMPIPPDTCASVTERQLRAENAALRQRLRWIPVDERLPPAGVEVCIKCAPPLSPYWVGAIRADGVWVGNGGVGISDRAIAWRHIEDTEAANG